MTPRLRKFTLTVHITSSIAWAGAVAVFLTLAVAGLSGQDDQRTRAAYLAMQLVTWVIILPLAFLSLVSGMISSLGTRWGLFRYYWILVKLLITLFSTIVLLVHMEPIDLLASAAANKAALSTDLRSGQHLMVVAGSAALLSLIVTTVLSVYKPRGVTPYGARKLQRQRMPSQPSAGA